MRKNQIFIILLMLAVLGGLSYYFRHWSTNKEDSESSAPSKSEAETNLEKSEHNSLAKKPAPEASPKSLEGTETSEAAASNGSAVKSQARLAQSGQSHILKLIDGAMLLGESTSTDIEGEKTIRVYDVGDRFKYPKVRVETLHSDTGVDRMTAMVADHLIIRVKDSEVSPAKVRDALSGLGVTIRKKMHTAGHYLVTLGTDEAVQVTALLESVHKRLGDTVEVAEPDYIVFTTSNIPDDSRFDQLWGMHNTGQYNGLVDADIDAPEAWEQTTGLREVRVAVIDTGVDYNHPDLAANIWINPEEIADDGIDNDENGFTDDVRGWDFYSDENDPMDTVGHGTHCAGTIGAVGNNEAGVVGVNWEVSILPLRFLGQYGGSTSDGIDSINYATQNGVNLSSNSWGGGGFSQLMKDAIAAAGAANQLFVIAAGNDGMNIENGPHYPSSYTFDDAIDNIISVASTTRHDNISNFSNYAVTKVDLGAPGSDIHSTTPGNNYSTYSGTSMATPHVAGACALYLSLNRDAEFQTVKQDLLETSDPIAALDGKCRSGGRLNLNDFVSRADASPIRVVSLAISGTVGLPDYFSPGETVTILPIYKNLSNSLVSSAVSELSTSATGINFELSRIDLANVQAGEVIEPESAFILTIPESFEVPGFIDLEIQTAVGGIDPSIRNIQLRVVEEAEVRGTVSDADTGEGIAGATVSLSGSLDRETLSSADGGYAFWVIGGSYSLDVSKPSYMSEASDFTTPVGGTIDFVLTQPQLEIDLPEVRVELMQGETREVSLALSNRGNGNLEWDLGAGGTLLPNGETMIKHTYSGEPYLWRDISGIGTRIQLGDESNVGPFNLGFDFLFYGQVFDAIRVSSNGFLSFSTSASLYRNLPLDSAYAPKNSIAFFWDDLDFSYIGSVAYYHRNDAGQMVFQFDNARYYINPHALFSAQVILSPDGSIQIHYKEIGFRGSATVGLRGVDASEFYQVSYNDTFGFNRYTLTFKPILLGEVLGEKSGTIGSNVHDLRIEISGESLEPGIYQDYLVINSSEDGGSVIRVPFTVEILGAPVLEISAQQFQEQVGLGDGDTVPEVGETLDLDLILENIGSEVSPQQTAKIIGGDSHIEVLQSESLYAPIPLGGKGVNQTPFVIRINLTAPHGHKANFLLKYFDADGVEVGSKAFEIKVQYLEQLNGSVRIYENATPIINAYVSCGEKFALTDSEGRFTLSFDAPGTYTITSEAYGFISEEKVVSMPHSDFLEFEMKNPRLKVNPRAYSAVLYKGDTHEGSILLSNAGNGSLEWEITSGDKLKYHDLPMDTPYVWNDISTLGERIYLGDDTIRGPYDLGFAFKFYNKSFDQIRVCSNGFLSFDSGSAEYNNKPLTASTVPNNLIAFFWDDLFFNSDSRAYLHRINNEQFIVQFDDVCYYNNRSARFSGQVVLKSDNSITIYYKQVGVANKATIGIRGNYSNNPREVKQVAFNAPIVQAGTALTLRSRMNEYGRITSPLSGTIDDETDIIRFTIDSSEMQPGYYRDFVVLNTNQPRRNLRTIPIELRVYQNTLYEQFLEKHAVPRLKWGIGEDDDHDGWSNLMEFAFGLDPTSSDGNAGLNLLSVASIASEGSLAAQNVPTSQSILNFEYQRRTDAAGLDYLFQSCDSLGADWLTIDAPNEVTSPTAESNIEKVQITVPVDSTKLNKFFRIQVVPK